MALDTSLFSTQFYKVSIKAKWSNPGKGVALSLLRLSVVAIEKGVFELPSTTVGQLTLTTIPSKLF